MIFNLLNQLHSASSVFAREVPILTRYDRYRRLRIIRFLRMLRYTPEAQAYEKLRFTMMPFILVVWLSYEAVWCYLLPADDAVRLVLFLYLCLAVFSLYSFQHVEWVVDKAIRLMYIVLGFMICLVWLYKERPQSEEEIMLEGVRHSGPPYPAAHYAPGYFESAYAGFCTLLLLFLALFVLNFYLGQIFLRMFKKIANQSLHSNDATSAFALMLDLLFIVPAILAAILIHRGVLVFSLWG